MEKRFEGGASGTMKTGMDNNNSEYLFNLSMGADVSRSPLHHHVGLTESYPRSSSYFSIQDERFSTSRIVKNKKNEN